MNKTSTLISNRPTEAYVFLSALNIFLSITATLGNALILVALHKQSSLYPPTKLLIRCLAVTDLCVGLINQPVFETFLMSFVTTTIDRKVTKNISESLSFTLCEVSVYVSTAISIDRLLALLLGLRYRHVVTLRPARAAIICFWLIGVSCASMFLWNGSNAYSVALILITLSITTSVLSYTKIYLKLRYHQLQLHVLQQQPNRARVPINIKRYKKSVVSILWVQLALVTCYVPFIIVVMLATYGKMSANNFEIPFLFTGTLTYLNSSLNPILYCWRMRAVRKAAKDTIKQLNCCKSA